MYDLAGVSAYNSLAATETKSAKNSTNTSAGSSLDMTDFLQLMVATLENQTIDDTADTSEMMSMMVQMSVVEALTNISEIVSTSSTLTYAASLVGKEVVIGQYVNGELMELSRTITGTGTLNGEQVIFTVNPDNGADESYYLTDIMAIGKLPGSGTGDTDDDTASTASASAGSSVVGDAEYDDTPVSVESPEAEDGAADDSGNENAWDLVSG